MRFLYSLPLVFTLFSLSTGYICNNTLVFQSAVLQIYKGTALNALNLISTDSLSTSTLSKIPKDPLLAYNFATQFKVTACKSTYDSIAVSWLSRDTALNSTFAPQTETRYARYADSIEVSGNLLRNVAVFKKTPLSGISHYVTYDSTQNKYKAFYGAIVVYDTLINDQGMSIDINGISSSNYSSTSDFISYYQNLKTFTSQVQSTVKPTIYSYHITVTYDTSTATPVIKKLKSDFKRLNQSGKGFYPNSSVFYNLKGQHFKQNKQSLQPTFPSQVYLELKSK